jgi:hypothetical protein
VQEGMQAEMSKKLYLLVRVIWVGCALASALQLLSCGHGALAGECRMLHWILLAMLTFPVGVAWGVSIVAIGVGIDYLWSNPVWPDYVFSVIELLQAVIVICLGYFQWFVLLPWLWRKWKAHRLSKANHAVSL